MKKIITIACFVLGFIIITSCSNGPKPIDYGNDGCHYCKMTIVDKIHGAELITNTGKIFKFDATECMLNYMSDGHETEVARYLTNHYENPMVLISANDATFLVSHNLPSPMGAYLTAFESQAEAEKVQADIGGELYSWEALKTRLMK